MVGRIDDQNHEVSNIVVNNLNISESACIDMQKAALSTPCQPKKKNKATKRKKKTTEELPQNSNEDMTLDDLRLFWKWLRSLSWDELRSAMEIKFEQSTKAVSRSILICNTTKFSLHEQDLLLEMIQSLPCKPTPIHPKALCGLFNVSPNDYGSLKEDMIRQKQNQQPRLFQLIKSHRSAFNFNFNFDLCNDGITSKKPIPSNNERKKERKQKHTGRFIDSTHSLKNTINENATKQFEVIARKFVMEDGERLTVGTTYEQQKADRAILQHSVWHYEYNVKEGRHSTGIRIEGLPYVETINDSNHLSFAIQDNMIRILKIASRGLFGSCIPTQQPENEGLMLAPWMNPEERWFSLSMYVTSCYEVSLWNSYRLYVNSNMQNRTITPPEILQLDGATNDRMRSLLYSATCRVIKEKMKKEVDKFNTNIKNLIPFRNSTMRYLLKSDTRELIRNDDSEKSRYPIQLREVIEFTCPLLDVKSRDESMKHEIWIAFSETVSDEYRNSLVQQLLMDQLNNDSDETQKIVNGKIPPKRRRNKKKEFLLTSAASETTDKNEELMNALDLEVDQGDTSDVDHSLKCSGNDNNQEPIIFESQKAYVAGVQPNQYPAPTADGHNVVTMRTSSQIVSHIEMDSDIDSTMQQTFTEATNFELVERRGKKKVNKTRGESAGTPKTANTKELWLATRNAGSCSTLKRSNLGNTSYLSLDTILAYPGTETSSQSNNYRSDFDERGSHQCAVSPKKPETEKNMSPSRQINNISANIEQSTSEIETPKLEVASDICIKQHINSSSTKPAGVGMIGPHNPPCHTNTIGSVSPESMPNPKALHKRKSPNKNSPPMVKISVSLDDKSKHIQQIPIELHPPILSFGSDPLEASHRRTVTSCDSLRASHGQNRSPPKPKEDSAPCRMSPVTKQGFATLRARDDYDIKSKVNSISRRAVDTLSNFRNCTKRDSTFRDDQGIKSEGNRLGLTKMSSYRNGIGMGNVPFNTSFSSVRAPYYNYNTISLESAVSCTDEHDFATRSETGFEYNSGQQSFDINVVSGNDDADNNTHTRDCSTTLSSPDTQVESDEVAALRDERNSYRDMCLTLGAEVAKLKNMMAAQTSSSKLPSTGYATGGFPIPLQNTISPWTHTISHHAYQFAPRARTLAAMSDAGCVDHESLASEDDLAGRIHCIDSLRPSSSLTISGSDTSLDPGSIQNMVPMRFTIKATRDVPDPVSLNGMQSRLTKDVFQYLESINGQLRKQDSNRRFAIERVSKLVNALWPRAQVKLYGSHVTGLCLPSSDLDFVVCLPAVHKNTMAIAAGELEVRNAINESSQKLLARHLKAESWIDPRSMKLIERTVVPVIKVSTKDVKSRMLQLDITFDAPNHHGREAAAMVAQIIDELPMIRPIVIVLKQFLLDRGLLTAYTGGLSSYCLFLMVARYLQEQPSSWGDCGALLMGFLDFYGNCFDPRTTGISVSHRLYFERPNYTSFRNQRSSQTLWNPVPPPQRSLGSSSIRRNSLSDRGSTDVAHAVSPGFEMHYPLTATNIGHHHVINPSNAETVDQNVFEHGMPYTLDPLFVEDPLSGTNNVGRNAFRIFQVQRAFSDAHRALVAALEWDMQSVDDQESSEYPLLKCLLQSEDVVFDL